MFMLSIVLGLFSATPLFAQSVEEQAHQDSQLAQVRADNATAVQIANIGKYGKIKLQSGVYSIVEVSRFKGTPSGITIYSMDPQDSDHRIYKTLFWGVVLNRRKINRIKFSNALKDPSTTVDCKTKSPHVLADMTDFILCQSNFTIDSQSSVPSELK